MSSGFLSGFQKRDKRGQTTMSSSKRSLKTSGRFAHKAYAYEHDFAVFSCDLRIVDSRLIVDMRHIKFHFLFPLQAAYILFSLLLASI